MAQLHRPTVRRQIVDMLTKEVTNSMVPGQRLRPESQLARRFGVALATVREALCALAERGLIERRHGSGTYVTDRNQRQPIGLLVSIDPQYLLTFCPVRLVQQLGARLSAKGYPVRTYMFVKPPDQPQLEDPTYDSFLEDIAEHRLCGVISVQGPADRRWVELARHRRIPSINGESCRVGGDGLDLVRQGVRYLAGQGHRRIALMGWFQPGLFDNGIREAFGDAVRDTGCVTHDPWIRGEMHPTSPGAGYEEFREIWAARAEKPDGLLVIDDILLPDVTVAILDHGIRVPDQLHVVASANKGNTTAPFFPATRLEFDLDHEAEVMTDLMVKLIRGQPISRREILLPCRLIESDHPPVSQAESPVHQEVRS